MTFQLFVILAVGVCAALASTLAQRRALELYWSRSCQGAQWKRAFPEASSTDIRLFLNIFTSSFGLHSRHRLKFAPSDGIMLIYRANSPVQGVDALELESFGKALECQYHFSLERSMHPGLTLGELFAKVHGVAP